MDRMAASVDGPGGAEPAESTRRAEILATAAAVFAQSGVRTSLKDIADAAGILPGSLYHHFESKDAIVAELVARYDAEIDEVARQAVAALHQPGSTSRRDLVEHLAVASFRCASRNRGALLLSLYERGDLDDDAVRSTPRTTVRPPDALVAAMLETLRAAREAGELRAGVDLPTLAHRLCQSLLHISLGVLDGTPGDDTMPTTMCRLLLEGMAARAPGDAELDRSAAFVAAEKAIAGWPDEVDEEDERVALLRTVARTEFGRRGYKATRIRDIARAARLSTATVYRLIGSKEDLLVLVMQSFASKITAGWEAVLASDATAIEKLDALMWVDINTLDRYSEEFRIQLGWFLESPPATAHLGWLFTTRIEEVQALLEEGVGSGEIRLPPGPIEDATVCVLELIWSPETLVSAGAREAIAFTRDAVLRGAAQRS
jgi:AcrR family transcriptional regulator